MSIIKYIFYRIRREEWLTLAILFVVNFINIFAYHKEVSLAEAVLSMFKYFTFGDPYYYLLFLIVCIFVILVFYTNVSQILVEWVLKNNKPSEQKILLLLIKILTPIRNILPLALLSGPVYELLGNFSYSLRFGLKDVLLARADYVLTRHYFFIELANTFTSKFANVLMYYSYVSLATVMGVTLLLLLFVNKGNLLRLAITAFIFSNVFAYPFFYFLPAPGPMYSLILNVRNTPIPEDIAIAVRSYNPSSYTKETTKSIMGYFIDRKRDDSAAVSSLPSMHATWALITAYFLWRFKKFTLIFTIPWVFFMLSGGLYFSLHYFIDYIAAVPVAMISVIFAHLLINGLLFDKSEFVNN